MDSNHEIRAALSEWVELLTDERTEPMDFDHLRRTLRDAAAEIRAADSVRSQLELLADDYRRRIAGMVKAIAAVDRTRDRGRQADDVIQSLTDCPAEKLIDCYRQVQARFKDFFPASFGLMDRPLSSRRSDASYHDVK